MANTEHLAILKQGAEVWNQWRKEHPNIRPDLTGADLREVHIVERDSDGRYLYGADLSQADLRGVNFWRSDISWATLYAADLSEANFFQAKMEKVDLRGSNLKGAMLYHAHLISADLRQADLTKANLGRTNLTAAHLARTNLSGADLGGAELNRTELSDANFIRARVGWTVFIDVDLSLIKGLDTVEHYGPSTLGIDTIYRSGGNIPEVFLRNAGVPDTFITFMRSLVGQPIHYYSCFISYSSKDQVFAERLHADLQSKGVRCWFAPEDMKIGDRIRNRLDESIKRHDKLLLVLSKCSIASQYVEQEVETALAREREEGRIVLFPIRLDNAIMEIESGWPALIRNTRHIGDFRHWKDGEAYQKAFDRLLRDLKAKVARGVAWSKGMSESGQVIERMNAA